MIVEHPVGSISNNETYPSRKITAIILAGGKGRRMGGIDKGLVKLNGRSLIEPIISAIAPHVNELLINANRNIEEYKQFGYPVISDNDKNFLGPLAGFLAAMKVAKNEQLIFLPCDGPFLKEELLQRLIIAKEDNSVEIAVAHDGNRMQPVYANLSKSLNNSLEMYLKSGQRKIDHWYKQHSCALVDCSDIKDCFININTLDECRLLETSNEKRKVA
jgi:molybdenum cofactor guanylyltransferase